MKVYSIGYAGRKINDFLKILKENKIQAVIDVRRFPTSKYDEYKKENLRKILKNEKIKYFHIKELGGFRKDYEEFMKSDEFKKGFEKILKIIKKYKSAIMCKEKNHKYCHRKFICKELEKNKINVIYLE